MTTSLITLGSYNLEAADPLRLADFWAGLTGGVAEKTAATAYIPPVGEGGFGVFLQPAEEPRAERQMGHLDLTVPWGHREAEVARAVGLGAEVRWHVLDEHPHVRWTTLADPEGNLFCIAEHPPQE